MKNTNFLPMPEDELPPIPAIGERGLHVCEVVRFYLPVLDELELEPEQMQAIHEHIRICAACAREEQRLQRAEQLIAGIAASEPSARVDQAILSVIAAQEAVLPHPVGAIHRAPTDEAATEMQVVGDASGVYVKRIESDTSMPLRVEKRQRRRFRRPVGLALATLAVAAVLLFALLPVLHFWGGSPPTNQAFHLPANLTWSGYVVFHKQTMMDSKGTPYSINAYHDLGNGMTHVETVESGVLDVVVVGDSAAMLGMDMMRHVAQWGANAWSDDESMFDLPELRDEIATHQAAYLGQELYQGQEVYLIRCKNGLVLALDMRYMPVNVLQNMPVSGVAESVYNAVELMPSSHVTNSMWNMTIPVGFHLGTLPPRP